MAKSFAPERSVNAATAPCIIFDAAGNPHKMARLNATEMVRMGGYFWKPEDAHMTAPESDGPADPKAKTITVFDAEGNAVEFSAINAREMVTSGAYFWNNPKAVAASAEAAQVTAGVNTPEDAEAQALTAVIDAANDLIAAEAAASEAAVAEAESVTAEVDPDKESLLAQAVRVEGHEDIAKYLDGFSEEALRDMSVKRYNEKPHHRAGKASIIERIVALEEAAVTASSEE